MVDGTGWEIGRYELKNYLHFEYTIEKPENDIFDD